MSVDYADRGKLSRRRKSRVRHKSKMSDNIADCLFISLNLAGFLVFALSLSDEAFLKSRPTF